MTSLTDLEEARLYSARDPEKGDLWLICWHDNHLVGIFPGPPVSVVVWHDLEVLDKEDRGYPLFVDPVPWPAGEHVMLVNAGQREVIEPAPTSA